MAADIRGTISGSGGPRSASVEQPSCQFEGLRNGGRAHALHCDIFPPLAAVKAASPLAPSVWNRSARWGLEERQELYHTSNQPQHVLDNVAAQRGR